MGTVLQDTQQSALFFQHVPLHCPQQGFPAAGRKLGSPPALSPLNQSRGWEPLGPSAVTQGFSIPYLLCYNEFRPGLGRVRGG